ncbi:MAG: calcium-translocating P-type ATPase, PMCA-type [Clostridia bacterium]
MWYTMSIEEVRAILNTDLRIGLKDKEILKRKKEYGENKLKEKKKKNLLFKFIDQFKDFMICILLIAAIISAFIAFNQNTNDYMDSIIIISIVVFNALMGLFQEHKAEKSLEALKKLSSPTAKVKRNSKILVIPSSELVPGDILLIESGNLIPADCRLINAYNLKVEESTLTGETIPVIKEANVRIKKNVVIGDMLNMVFASTIVVSGHGEAIVTNTAMNTKVGKIANMIISDDISCTPLQRKLADVGKKLGIACLVICLCIFVIGIFKKISIMEMFMTSIGLAVAAIPEGLPAIVTILLSIGVTKMAKKNAIIKKLPAVETLGSSSVICSDKTGTLTQNKMEVVKIYDVNSNQAISKSSKVVSYILGLATMCNDSKVQYSKFKSTISGEPTEVAIVNAGLRIAISKDKLDKEYERLNEIPFESSRKLMTTIHKRNNTFLVVTKGAPDSLLKRCSKVYDNGKVVSLSRVHISKIEKHIEEMASDALRVLGVAFADINSLPNKMQSDIIENNLVFVGLIAMIDPPRDGVRDAVKICKKAGIKTVMITGDHILTAKAIATNLSILNKGDLAITGQELDAILDNDFKRNIMKYSVFARVSPEHKVRIVKAFKSSGAIVAMTGDGVNDAPALKNADIGVAMGLNGTDVAKSASDMVLTDDNFVTIVQAVKEGRHIYENIRKAVHFLIATNIGEIVTIFLGLLLGLQTPLLAIQLLWINLVTDSFPALGLGMEKADKYIMNKKPKNSRKGLFSDGLWGKIFFEGTMIGILTLVAFNLGTTLYGLEVGRTMAFLSLGLIELVHSFNIRSDSESILSIGIFSNKYLIVAFLIGVILQILVVIIEPIAKIFDVVSLSKVQWFYTIIISLCPIIIIEMKKKIHSIFHTKPVYDIYSETVK